MALDIRTITVDELPEFARAQSMAFGRDYRPEMLDSRQAIFEFDRNVFGDVTPSSWVLWDGPGQDDMAFVVRALGANAAVGFYGG